MRRIEFIRYFRSFPSRNPNKTETFVGWIARFDGVEGVGRTREIALNDLKEAYLFFLSVGIRSEPFPEEEGEQVLRFMDQAAA